MKWIRVRNMKTQSKTEYGNKVRSIRAYLGMSQEQMAHKIGVSIGTLSNYERGLTVPPANIWDRIKGMMPEKGDA